MKFFILVYNPTYINPIGLEYLIRELKDKHPVVSIHWIEHLDNTMAPLYILNSEDSQLDIYLKEIPKK